MLDSRSLKSGVIFVYRLPAMPADRPSVPVSTRSMFSCPASSWALSLPARFGAFSVLVVTLLMMSGWALTKSSKMPCVSCRLPATSSTFSATGLDGFAGIELAGAADCVVVGPGALQAEATRAAAASVASRPTPVRYRRLRESTIEGTPPFGSGRRPQTAGGWVSREEGGAGGDVGRAGVGCEEVGDW